ncbi:DNA polymerase III subunit alpha [Kurthia sibirica]|uniref:DNA polymerase III subunit alpha n=1 Tax=Kurthia sibirica TaxID=202750 RepID=A0A2U3ANS3_9BACL|nr:DNA polymerase III subunit alpha [Kurthia sibirica]PWI26200.1 DNA polymerase III subunit alpha [Kurthia sibirica]GEK34713.1 DNA polymerase III subunit alpha [Kurthia sibirica]
MHAHYSQIITSASMLDSIVRVEELSTILQQYEQSSVAITDPKLYGLLQFYKEMTKNNIHAVLGLTVVVTLEEDVRLPLILYAKNKKGYHHLLKISSAIALREQGDLPLKWLQGYQQGLIAMLPVMDEMWQLSHADYMLQFHSLFQADCFIGIERVAGKIAEYESSWQQLAEQAGISIMSTQKVTFMAQQDVAAYEAALAIQQGMRIEDREPLSMRQQMYYLPTMDDYVARYRDQPQWLENEKKMLASCQVDLAFDKHYMPIYKGTSDQSSAVLFQEQCIEGLKKRGFSGQVPYEERLAYEMSVISEMGYEDYFLIVADYIQFARSKRILTGPGRGSSASSLVAYCLEITNVDPLHYDLLFERFLNPQRVTLPDIDVDFADAKRQDVIDYVAEKYGIQYATQIITFGTLSAKAVARDVARVLGFSMDELSKISSLLQGRNTLTLHDAMPQLTEWIGDEPLRQKWLQIALKLEGLNRNASTHAAGVVLSPIPLPDIAPIEKGGDHLYITQWPMKEIEEIGLLKMDFLGLRNLTVLDHIRSLIFYNEKRFLDFNKIPLQDTKTFQLLQSGDTTGVFQLESSGMRAALKEIKPTTFADIVAVNALYRPGPMDFIPVYSRRKHHQEPVQMPHKVLEPILGETFGVIVYQEQIMRIAAVMAGFSLGEADLLRRAVSKKNKKSLDAERQRFVAGALQKGFSQQVADEVYDLIVRFANYGFPKSHAVAYSMITYQMAYLKANFAPYFYAAILTSALGDKEKQQQILREAKTSGIEILPPSIIKSGRGYRVEEGKIRLALGSIKGVPNTFLTRLQALRKENNRAPFKTIFDMALSMSALHFKRKAVEPLVKAGALDDFGQQRSVLLATIDRAEKLAALYSPTEESTLFYDTAVYGVPKHAKADILSESDKLNFEKEVLGFYISTHPVTKIKADLQRPVTSLARVSSIKERSYLKCIANIVEIKKIRTKKGEQMAFLQLEDDEGTVSATLFPQTFQPFEDMLQEGQLIYAEGFIEYRNHAPQLVVKKIELLT